MICTGQKGFLTLSKCDKPVLRSCTSCSRPFCATHLAAQTGFAMCLDCAAKDPNVEKKDYDDTWAHSYRDSYYTSTGYLPVYAAGMSHRFDSTDSHSFDERVSDVNEDEGEGGGFGAS